MLNPETMTKSGQAATDGSDELFRSITRLSPNAGVQFIDIELPSAVIDGVVRTFSIERISLQDGGVWALSPAKPIPAKPNPATSSAGSRDTDGGRLRVDGRSAIKSAMDRWLPLPLLRFMSRDEDGRPRFDDGPGNWVRLFLSSKSHGGNVRGVIAIDTAIDRRSRLDVDAYLAPNADDIRFLSTFALTDEAEPLAQFLAEEWVQDWIENVFPAAEMRRAGQVTSSHSLYQLASYLALLTVVRRAGVLPSLQFFDVRAGVVPPVPIDLVMDIGQSRSCCLLVESSLASGRPVVDHAALLPLRDLSNPVDVYAGTFDSRVELARAVFGPEALSRRSGRIDAFHWPSLVRTGHEAVRLSRFSRSDDGPTGLASPKRHLLDMKLRADTWRFALDRRTTLQKSPMVSGRLLAVANGPGGRLLTGPAASAAPQTSRVQPSRHLALSTLTFQPRFALSTMMSFFIAEVLLQALATINAPVVEPVFQKGTRRTAVGTTAAASARRADGVRRLRHIIVCVPLTLPLDERQLMRERAEAAVDMLWRTLDWDEQANGEMPPRPTVRLGLDETLSAQLVYLFDEVGHRFGGDVRSVMSSIGKNRPDIGPEPCLRVGALDVGGGHTTMTVVTYGQSAEQPVVPTLLGAQRSDIGGEVVVDRIIAELIVPAVKRALLTEGIEGVESLLARHAASPGTGTAYDIGAASTRLHEHWLRPAALGLLTLAHDAPSVDARVTTRLDGLVARQAAGMNRDAAQDFSRAVVQVRAADGTVFDIGAVEIHVRVSDVLGSAKAALAPMVARLSRALVASDCDLVLLTGWSARLVPLRDLLLEAMPWRPDRIIDLNERVWQDWYPMEAGARQASDGKDIGLIGALLALSGGGMGFGSGDDGSPFDGSFEAPLMDDPSMGEPS